VEESQIRKAVQVALSRNVVAQVDPDDEAIGDLQVAEYVVFLLSLDTYMRYVEEATNEEPQDEVTMRGVRLLRISDAMISEGLQKVLNESLPTEVHKKMLARAMAIRAINPTNAGRRALMLRTILSRGGPGTQRAVFQTNRALKEIREAIAASMMDDADAALDKFAAIQMRNTRLKTWIDLAAKTAVQREIPKNAVDAGSKEAVDQASVLLNQQVQSAGARGAEEVEVAQTTQSDVLSQVEQDATNAARKALETSGEPDRPPSKSEVVGIAVAAAAAALGDPSKPQNVPDPLRKLDDEQRAAALTDGRVLVAAGAGSGKSTTLVARVEYLVKERRVFPSRILVTSFNTKAANELKQKIGSATSGETLQQMSVGTMHSLFRKFIGEYGTPQERSAMGLGQDRGGFVQGGGAVARAVQRIWSECFPPDTPQEKKVPKLKNVLMAKSKWSGNNVTPAEAMQNALSPMGGGGDPDSALWYEMYEGLKGAIPGWKPPCRTSKGYESFMGRWRPNNQRLGDFDDMLIIFRSILKREPMVRKTLQGMFDHILVDECQDLNQCQNDIVEMMSEHIKDGSDGKSVWMVGDPNQSIYTFRGARPDIFLGRAQKEDWKVRTIRTNYRCQPEIVDAANKLISHNEGRLQMEAVPSSAKSRGVGSIRVFNPGDEAEAALDAVEEIKSNIEAGGDVADNAILTRTNKEQHAFETACIIRGVPYARKGASSFLGSPETKAFLSYVQLATGDDFSKMQQALGEVINKPNRFFIAPDAGVTAVQDAISAYARRNGQDVKVVNPLVALGDPFFQSVLAEKLTKQRAGFKFNKAIEKLEEIGGSISEMQANSANPEFTTKDLFDSILGMTGLVAVTDPISGKANYVEQTFRDSLKADLRDAVGEDADEDDEDDTEGLGNISFLFELTKKDPTDPGDLLTDPNTPTGFKAKMERYGQRARELRIDITKWDKDQAALPPEQRKAPPGVYLGTVHSVKGAQWKNCYVSMPKGKFPFEPPVKPGQPPPPPNPEEMESERRLGYVALTRAAMNLTVICPKSVGGKAAGISRFVDEAGLHTGENVPKPGATPSIEASPEVQGILEKTASEFEGVVPDEWKVN
jgi:superfamily I DNA/RNA helicase